MLGGGDDRLQFLSCEDGLRAGGVDRGSLVTLVVDLLELFVVVGIGIDVRSSEKSLTIVHAGLATNVIESQGAPDLLTEDMPLRVRVVVGWRVEVLVAHKRDGLLDVASPGPDACYSGPLRFTEVVVANLYPSRCGTAEFRIRATADYLGVKDVRLPSRTRPFSATRRTRRSRYCQT